MEIACPSCQRTLTYSGDCPCFCAYCGKSLPGLGSTAQFHAVLSKPPSITPTPEAETIVVAPGIPGAFDSGLPPTRIGGYQLLRRLGGGGMGEVFEAEHCEEGRRVAIKLIGSNYGDSADAVERFRREGRLASTLAHPRCVFVYAVDEDAGRPYIVMELMPGQTLQQLIEGQGPLPVGEAVAKILDVIDGLSEAHATGVVHRDVKPSNCFLTTDGRVKVGDFGLAKSLVLDDSLTKTGTFLGTMLYASPEQIRRDPVDGQSDLYSVAATLYFLLTGQAPFQSGDAVATVARVVSEDAPSMRALKPELPRHLDQIVLRGLQRDRERRYRDLHEFRRALLPFAPGQITPAPLGLRFAAYAVDLVLFAPFGVINGFVTQGDPTENWGLKASLSLGFQTLFCAYLAICEARWGATLGKLLFGLRVLPTGTFEPPGWYRALLRVFIYQLPFLFAVVLLIACPWWGEEGFMIGSGISLLISMLAIFWPLLTMRHRNGWRGPHELVSATRTVLLPIPSRRFRLLAAPAKLLELPPADDLPARIGPFTVRGILRQDATERMVVGEDSALGRSVVLWLRQNADPRNFDRSSITRSTRWRWLASGVHANWQWNAFLTLGGMNLSDYVARRRLSWPETRYLLEQLASELSASCAEGSLPGRLTIEQIWLQPGGQLQLLDAPFIATPEKSIAEAQAPESRAVDFLAEVARTALEGNQPTAAKAGTLRAPLPGHALSFLHRLVGPASERPQLAEIEAEFERSRDLPTETSRGRRLAALVTWCMLHTPGIAFNFALIWMICFMLMFFPKLNELALERYGASAAESSNAFLVAGMVQPDLTGQLVAATLWSDTQNLLRRADTERRRAALAAEGVANGYTRTSRFSYQPVLNITIEQVQSELHENAKIEDLLMLRSRLGSFSQAGVDPSSVAAGVQRVIARGFLAAWPGIWMVCTLIVGNGISFRLHGLMLVCSDGSRAGRLRCAWREFLVWVLPTTLWTISALCSATYAHGLYSSEVIPGYLAWMAFLSWWASVATMALWFGLALRYPRRGPHDWLAGTYVVPQ